MTDYLEQEQVITNEKFETLFQIALLFDEIGLQSWSKFINRLSTKPLDNFELFENKENLLRLLYVWNLSRRQVNVDRALLIELQTVKFFHFNKLDLKECGLICLGFHKTQIKFQTNLIEQIAEKLINEIETLDDPICLVSILKGIYSSDFKLSTNLLNRIKESLINSKFENDFFALTRLLAIQKKYKFYDEVLINKTLDTFAKQDSVRIKELSRLLLNLLFFNVELNSRQIGKFNELFEHFKSNFTIYRIEYLLSVYALASHGLIRKEEIYNIYDPEFIKILKTKYDDIGYFFVNLNNILKLYGDANYKNIALKDDEILRSFKSLNAISKKEVYDRFKRFDHYSSKLYLTFQTLKERINNERVHFVHVLPGVKYPSIVISPKKCTLKDYPFDVKINSAKQFIIIQVPPRDVFCDHDLKRINGFFRLENDLLKQMGFRLFRLDNQRISHNTKELGNYLHEEVISKLDEDESNQKLI